MALLRARELRRLSRQELQARLEELQLELLKLRAQRASVSPGPAKKLKELKRAIARLNYQLAQKHADMS